jgi:hypothetical protein
MMEQLQSGQWLGEMPMARSELRWDGSCVSVGIDRWDVQKYIYILYIFNMVWSAILNRVLKNNF